MALGCGGDKSWVHECLREEMEISSPLNNRNINATKWCSKKRG